VTIRQRRRICLCGWQITDKHGQPMQDAAPIRCWHRAKVRLSGANPIAAIVAETYEQGPDGSRGDL